MFFFIASAVLGVTASIPIACACWIALAPQRFSRRLTPAVPLLVLGVTPVAYEFAYENDPLGYLFIPAVYTAVFAMNCISFASIRATCGLHFSRSDCDEQVLAGRYSIRETLVATGAVALLLAAWTSSNQTSDQSIRFTIAYPIVLICCGILPHLAFTAPFAAPAAWFRRMVYDMLAVAGSITAAKLIMLSDPNGGPFTQVTWEHILGFASGFLGLQILVAGVLRALGYLLTTPSRR